MRILFYIANSEYIYKCALVCNYSVHPLGLSVGDVAIPEESMIEVKPQPTGLQVFANVGGLALLAEHLPLLYPEVTQAATMNTSPEKGPEVSLGTDWVKVESEEYYEVICMKFLVLCECCTQ